MGEKTSTEESRPAKQPTVSASAQSSNIHTSISHILYRLASLLAFLLICESSASGGWETRIPLGVRALLDDSHPARQPANRNLMRKCDEQLSASQICHEHGIDAVTRAESHSTMQHKNLALAHSSEARIGSAVLGRMDDGNLLIVSGLGRLMEQEDKLDRNIETN